MTRPQHDSLLLPSGSPRFDLTPIDDEGVLLDASTGQILWLNATAVQVWRWFLSGMAREEMAATLARRYDIPIGSALSDVTNVLLIPTHRPGPRNNDIEYLVSDGKFMGATREGPVLELSPQGDRIALLRSVGASELEAYLLSLAPKLLALSGKVVLHASGVMRNGKAVAFSGASGAGKTTTAFAFGVGDASVIAEDLIVMRTLEGGVEASTDVERIIVEWAARAATDNAHKPGDIIEFAPWGKRGSTNVAPLVAVHFLDREQRNGSAIRSTPISRAQTTALLFGNTFIGSLESTFCRDHLTRVMEIATRVRGYQSAMPDGVAELAEAAAAHSLSWPAIEFQS